MGPSNGTSRYTDYLPNRVMVGDRPVRGENVRLVGSWALRELENQIEEVRAGLMCKECGEIARSRKDWCGHRGKDAQEA